MKAELLVGGTLGTTSEVVTLDRDVLTTHGVILGMTGSGKTGLAVVLLEELARKHVPLVICDLKGDLTNLLLTFPGLAAADFAPYLPATQAGADRAAAAAAIAARWRDGLSPWSLGEAQIREVRDGVAWRLLTPGSGLAPVNLLPALDPPPGYDPDLDPDSARVRLDGTVAGLLALVDRGGDPLSNRDHVLLATLLDAAWRQGKALDLRQLVAQIADPPVALFGVLDAETFYPRKERQELLLAFNIVLASPSFAVWTRGVPLAVDELMGAPEAPRATILYLAHLADRERLSFLTLLASALLSWTRSQAGSDSLRVLLYIDEVQGILPPTAMPPTKPPLLTLLKQGRAFGTGVLLATQNPVDLDYKALGNIGLKLVGRLDTENDRVAWHRALRLVQNEGEAPSAFAERCRQADSGGAGKEAEVRHRYEEKMHKLDERLAKEQLELTDDEREASARSRDTTIAVASGIGEAVLGALFGRRSGLDTLARRGASTVRAYGSKDRLADRAAAEVEQSRQTIAQLEADKQRLAAELQQELALLRQAGAGIETLRLTPAHKDIAVRRVALGWLPQGGGG